MSSTSQKHRDFVAEPMGDKPVTALSGIGDVLGKKLAEQGFDKAFIVLGQFLLLRKDRELFSEWLKDTCGANSKQADTCSQCLSEWTQDELPMNETGQVVTGENTEVRKRTGSPRMSSTSQKHRDFVAEPMGDKPVTALSGIGDVLGKKLAEQGFDKAFIVSGQFLLLKKDRELLSEWLKDTCGPNSKQADTCSQCLSEWCDTFL